MKIEIELDELTKEERETVKRLAEKKKPYWAPKKGETYFLIDEYGFIADTRNDKLNGDDFAISIGNCFRTREEAEEAVTRLRMQMKWKRLSLEAGEADNPWDGEHEHWAVCFGNGTLYYWDFVNMNYGTTHFPSLESLEAAISELGEKNIKKYILGVEE